MEPREILSGFLRALRSKDLWYNFDTGEIIPDANLRLMVQQGLLGLEDVSSEPDIFPVFGNLDNAVDVHMPELVAYARSLRDVPKRSLPQEKPVYSLYPAVRGFHNPSNYCFMDSTLVGMFAFQGSPFYRHMVEEPFAYGATALVCADTKGRDKEVRLQIRATLASDVQKLIEGKPSYTCSKLRDLLGRVCRPTREAVDERTGKPIRVYVGTNLSSGIHDPSELYLRLLNAMNYAPLEVATYFETRVGSRWIRSSIVKREAESFLTLTARDETLSRIRWPDTWNGASSELEQYRVDPQVLAELESVGESPATISALRLLESKTNILKRDRMVVYRADAFVVYLDRRKRGGSEMAVNDRRIEVDHKMDIPLEDGTRKSFVLRAVVYPPWAGHFRCLLRNGDQWLDYDDLGTQKTLAEKSISADKANTQINKRGVLFFYF